MAKWPFSRFEERFKEGRLLAGYTEQDQDEELCPNPKTEREGSRDGNKKRLSGYGGALMRRSGRPGRRAEYEGRNCT
jgi:hypothetical protein